MIQKLKEVNYISWEKKKKKTSRIAIYLCSAKKLRGCQLLGCQQHGCSLRSPACTDPALLTEEPTGLYCTVALFAVLVLEFRDFVSCERFHMQLT